MNLNLFHSGTYRYIEDILWSNCMQEKDKDMQYYEIRNRKRLCAGVMINVYETYIEMFIDLYRITRTKKILDYICKYFFDSNQEIIKITTFVVDNDYYGRFFLKKSGFKVEVKHREYLQLNGKNRNLYIVSRFRKGWENEL